MTQYIKNTDVPNEDSFLWQLGNGWKVSQKTGDVYAPIDSITDEQLGTVLTDIAETGKVDVIDYQSYFFVPNKFKDKWSVFAFENRVKADKKLADIKKFAGYQPKAPATVPKPQTTNVAQQIFASKPVTTSTSAPTQSTILTPHARLNNLTESTNNTIKTFTDPTPVRHDDKELIATMLSDGFVFLPSSIVERNCWDRSVYDDENNIVGTQLVFLMGRIINVKIPDNE